MLIAKEVVHQKGERYLVEKLSDIGNISVDTFDGKVHIKWDPQASVTAMGQLPFFIDFLKATRLFESWVRDCPLLYFSNNASKKRDVLGTFLLSILSGHTRYSHITALRSDNVNPALLGMHKVVSEDAARRALSRLSELDATNWLTTHLEKCYAPLLELPWILDIDSTVKPLYGCQEGAKIGYNPVKPGRPSHTYHTYFIANIRVILDTEIHDGKSISGCYSAPRLWSLIDKLDKDKLPKFIRGDSSYGNEGIMRQAENRQINYLFKLKCTSKVKHLIINMMEQRDWSCAGHGWEGIESSIRLSGWTYGRRVIVLRRKLSQENIGVLSEDKFTGQLSFDFASISPEYSAYEYSVLVTNLSDEILTIAQHYRDRADCENNFDELKNQWGWAGYTTQDLNRCQITARMIALIYNWWTLFVRLANPDSHLEAITSRPLLLNSIGKQTTHAGQKHLTITSTHAKANKVSLILSRITKFLKFVKESAEQLGELEILRQVLMVAFRKFIPVSNEPPPKWLTSTA